MVVAHHLNCRRARQVRRRLYLMWPAVVASVVVVMALLVPEVHPSRPKLGLVVLSSVLVAMWVLK